MYCHVARSLAPLGAQVGASLDGIRIQLHPNDPESVDPSLFLLVLNLSPVRMSVKMVRSGMLKHAFKTLGQKSYDMNLVNELQISAERDDVLTVLRKTKRLASKLDRQDIADWLQAERAGYVPGQCVPDYRKVVTTLAYNTNGYIPSGYGYFTNGIKDLHSFDMTEPLPVKISISSILAWIESLTKGESIYFPIPEGTDYSRELHSVIRFNPMFAHKITFLLRLNDSQIRAIPEQIKDKVLDWACALESAGVTGEGMSFNAREKEIAHSITFNISNSHIEQLNNSGTNQRNCK